MSSLTRSPLRRKEGRHYQFDDIEFWAEDGVICIIDMRNGDVNAVMCSDFRERALVLYEEAKRATLPSDIKRLRDCVIDMHDAYRDAQEQGDPADPAVLRQRLRERKRAIMMTGSSW